MCSKNTHADPDLFVKWAGKYRLGPVLTPGCFSGKGVKLYLARKDKSDEFYVVKVLTLKDEEDTPNDLCGKRMLLREESLLGLLKDEEGVVKLHEVFRDNVPEKFVTTSGETVIKAVRRVCFVFDCYERHDYSLESRNVIDLGHLIMKENRLTESKAIRIFYKILKIVERLHKRNIIHRDLKITNIIYNLATERVTLVNFYVGKHLFTENEGLTDPIGSLPCMSPECFSGKPYFGKPSDIWSLGVILYNMLYTKFPFSDQNPKLLVSLIRQAELQVPVDVVVSRKTVELIEKLLEVDPSKRLTVSQALENVCDIISTEEYMMRDSDLQVVPDCPPTLWKGGYKLSSFELGDLATILLTKK